MTVFSLTLRDKISPRLMKLCLSIVDLAEGVKWFVIMLRESVMVCTNDVGSNLADERKTPASNLIVKLLGLHVQTLKYI